MKPSSTDSPPPEPIVLHEVPPEAVEVGSQPMRCEWCGRHYSLPLYEMPDGPVVSVARCRGCGATSNQIPLEVAT